MTDLGFDPHKVKFIVLDADGTLTDAGIYLTASGEEIKKFNARDGLAMSRLNNNGLPVAILSHSKNEYIIKKRAEMLGLKYWYAGQEKKSLILNGWLKVLGIGPEDVLYLGDDLNDLDVFQMVGVGVCPADADPLIMKYVKLILNSKGGDACFRELADRAFRDILLFQS